MKTKKKMKQAAASGANFLFLAYPTTHFLSYFFSSPASPHPSPSMRWHRSLIGRDPLSASGRARAITCSWGWLARFASSSRTNLNKRWGSCWPEIAGDWLGWWLIRSSGAYKPGPPHLLTITGSSMSSKPRAWAPPSSGVVRRRGQSSAMAKSCSAVRRDPMGSAMVC
jgi:hypothetical protein